MSSAIAPSLCLKSFPDNRSGLCVLPMFDPGRVITYRRGEQTAQNYIDRYSWYMKMGTRTTTVDNIDATDYLDSHLRDEQNHT